MTVVRLMMISGLLMPATPFSAQDVPAGERDPKTQQEGDDGSGRGEQPSQPLPASEREEAVWKLHARAVADRFDLTEHEAAKLLELYLRLRTEHAAGVAEIRRAYREYLADRIKHFSEGKQEIDPKAFELPHQLSMLLRWKRQQLAEAMVKLFGKERAEEIYPPLAPFDGGHDKMIFLISEYQLNDELTFKAIGMLDEYYLEAAKAESEARRLELPLLDAVEPVRKKLLENLTAVLTDEQVQQFARKSRLVRPERGRRGADDDDE